MSNKDYDKGHEKGLIEGLQERNYYLEESIKRGKTITILLPLVNPEFITELLSELHDLRKEVKELKENPFKKLISDSQYMSYRKWRDLYPNFGKWLDDNGFVYNYRKDKHKKVDD